MPTNGESAQGGGGGGMARTRRPPEVNRARLRAHDRKPPTWNCHIHKPTQAARKPMSKHMPTRRWRLAASGSPKKMAKRAWSGNGFEVQNRTKKNQSSGLGAETGQPIMRNKVAGGPLWQFQHLCPSAPFWSQASPEAAADTRVTVGSHTQTKVRLAHLCPQIPY